jgi:redox-sensitive bicupin YhaK (pirin superfamily)
MLDYAAPENFPATKRRRGVGQHPHRGFETVTLAYNGEVSHADSTGMKDTIFPGDVQWMTAASGIFHEEFHSEEFAKKGGTFEMVQLWVDLPADLKMSPPKYQPLRAADFPTVALSARSSVRVIAGSLHGVTGTANTHTPMHLWDVKIAAGEAVELPVESGFNTMFFVRSGQVYIDSKKYGKKTIEPARLVVFEQDGSSVRMEATQNTELLFLSGQPLDQPIAARGPFVMCTQQELREAMVDFQNGNLVRHK